VFDQLVIQARRSGCKLAATAIAFSFVLMLAFSTPAGARSLSLSARIAPVGALSGSHTKVDSNAQEHGLGALRPTKQVKAAPSRRLFATLPASVDLSTFSVLVGDQGSVVGSCVTWTIDYAMLGWYSRHDNKPGQPFNPMYTYSQIHLDNSPSGGGSYATSALNVAFNQGNDTLAHYSTHSTTDFTSQPNAADRANAANYKIAAFQTLFAYTAGGGGTAGATLIKSALAAGKPVAIALPIRPGFDYVGKTASDVDDDITGAIRGNHEILATGYDQYGLWIQNSWGTGWGYFGYARLSWRVVANDVYQAHTISGFATSGSATDRTPPVVGAVGADFALNQMITSSTEPVDVTWSASDASGIAAYAVYVKTDGGPFVQDTSVPATATRVTYGLAIGHAYQIAVSAKDGAGNWSGYSYSVSITPQVTDDSAFTLTSSWRRYPLTGTFGGTYIATSLAGASVQKTFSGHDIALIAPRFSTAGRATIYCDGTPTGMIDLYSASTVTRQIVAKCHFAQSGQHTMKAVAEGTAGRPWLAVDAFAMLQ
jgi:hypothetical protein